MRKRDLITANRRLKERLAVARRVNVLLANKIAKLEYERMDLRKKGGG